MRKTALSLALIGALPSNAKAAPPSAPHMDTLVRLDESSRVPSPRPPQRIVVDEMLRLAWVGRHDVVYDLGCGDGRVVVAAARRNGALGVCVGEDDQWIDASSKRAQHAGVVRRVTFVQAVPVEANLKKATVVSLSRPLPQGALRHKLMLELRPGSRIVAHDVDLGEEWRPDVVEEAGGSTINLWIVPTSVHGRWSFHVRGSLVTLDLKQNFQKLSGTVRMGDWEQPISSARLRGYHITFIARPDPARNPMKFEGIVNGDRIRGARETGANMPPAPWIAVREAASVYEGVNEE